MLRFAMSPRGPLCAMLLLLAGCMAWPTVSTAQAGCVNEESRVGPSSGLPDCRAYELVSPAEKGGADVMLDTARTRVAQSERPGAPMAVMFPSLGGFADTHGSGVATDYMSIRTLVPGTQGWQTHAVTPLQESMSFQNNANQQDPHYVGDASPDLTKAVFQAWSPLTSAPNVAALENLYLRPDMRSDGSGTFQLLTDAFGPLLSAGQTFRQLPKLAGTSTDFSHVLFESVFKLTPDAPAPVNVPKLYEAVNGTVRYVAILPPDEGGGPAPRSIAGQGAGAGTGAGYTPGVISADGARVIFTVPTGNTAPSGRLYLRDDHGTADLGDDTTVQLNRSEATTPESPQPATYQNASADASKIFFTTTEALTDDAPVGNIAKLYMYDAAKPDADPAKLTFISPDNEGGDLPGSVMGTLGVSSDGTYVYFLQEGQSVGGAPVLNNGIGIYVWHQGEGLRFIGQLVDSTADPSEILGGGGSHNYGLQPQLGALVTADGHHLLFSARQPPLPGGHDNGNCPGAGLLVNGKVGCRELYLYDAASGGPVRCVSCDPGGVPPTTPAFYAVRTGWANAATASHLNRPVTADGRRVFFTTGEALVAGDQNGHVKDVYEFDGADQTLRLLSSGTSPTDSYFLEATPDGHDVFFATREKLSPWDTDQNIDIYDARVDGGVAGPVTPPAGCAGDSCQGALLLPPSGLVVGSGAVVRSALKQANHPRKAVRCRKGLVRRRVHGRMRCVTKARHEGQKAARGGHAPQPGAGTNVRASAADER